MTWAYQKVKTNGIHINIHRTGKGEKPPVVLLHGITDNGLCWTRTARDLEADYDVIMVDARGHGESDKPETGYGPGDHAGDVAGVINKLELTRPVLIGHSMGGSTAAHAAAMYGDKLRGVIFIDPPLREPGQGRDPDEVKKWRKGIAQKSKWSLQDLMQEARQNGWDELEIEPWATSKQQVSPEVTEYVTAQRTHWRDLLPRIDVPALLVTGDVENGAIITPEIAKEAVDLLQLGQHKHIAGTGHNIHREDYTTCIDAIQAFLSEQLKER